MTCMHSAPQELVCETVVWAKKQNSEGQPDVHDWLACAAPTVYPYSQCSGVTQRAATAIAWTLASALYAVQSTSISAMLLQCSQQCTRHAQRTVLSLLCLPLCVRCSRLQALWRRQVTVKACQILTPPVHGMVLQICNLSSIQHAVCRIVGPDRSLCGNLAMTSARCDLRARNRP